MNHTAPSGGTRTTAEELLTRWREAKRSVRGLHEALFFRPLLAAALSPVPTERPDAATVLDELERRDQRRALITLCIGAGMGIATIIERV